ncbi:MAG: energy transducer TonB [Candidatus Goldiibacteriota bacterium]
MFAGDYDIKGNVVGWSVSILLHALIILMFFMIQAKQKRIAGEYTLTEVTFIETIPDEEVPVPIEKPKTIMDVFKQVIPIKQDRPEVELAKPKEIKLEKPKMELEKSKSLELSKLDSPKLDPKKAKIDLSNEVGREKLSAAEVQKIETAKKQQKLSLADKGKKIDLAASNKPKSMLPRARPGISTIAKKDTALKPSKAKIEKPTAEPRETLKKDITIKKDRGPLLITGQIANRTVLKAVTPVYPRWAQQQGIEAEVAVFLTVLPDGTVKDDAYVRRSSGHSELDELALDAIKQFRFAPKGISGDETGIAIFRFQLTR